MKLAFSVFVLLACMFAADISQAQTWKWVTGSRCPKNVLESWPIALDGYGNVYAAGTASNLPGPAIPIRSYFGADSVIGKGWILTSTDSNGNYRWAEMPSAGAGFTGIAADHDHVYVFGSFFLSMTMGSYYLSAPWNGSFCAKFDTAGHLIWAKKIADSSFIAAGVTDGAGNLYLAGSFNATTPVIGSAHLVNNSPGDYDALVVKLDSSGTPVWATSFGGDHYDHVGAITVDASGSCFVTGQFNSTTMSVGASTLAFPGSGGPSGVVAKISPAGTPLWGDQIIVRNSIYLNSICVDHSSNVYVAGGTVGTSVFGSDSLTYIPSAGDPFFMVSYNSAGSFRWLRSRGIEYRQAQSVVADACNNIWVCGGIRQLVTLKDTMYIMAYDTSGYVTDSFTAPTGGDDQACLVADNKGSLYLCGDSWTAYHSDTFMFGSHPLIDADSSLETLFIAKVSYPTCPGFTLETPRPVSVGAIPVLYPNPANDECTISIDKGLLSKAEVYDMAGRLAASYTLSGSNTTISTSDLRPGFYTCVITAGENERYTQKLVIMRR